MSSRDEAVKVGADALAAGDFTDAQTVRDICERRTSSVLAAAHEAGLIVWTDELELWGFTAPYVGDGEDVPVYRKREAS